MTRYGRPSGRLSKSNTRTMFGWLRLDVISASRRKRSMMSGDMLPSAASTLRARAAFVRRCLTS